jgi:hypothetical protein
MSDIKLLATTFGLTNSTFTSTGVIKTPGEISVPDTGATTTSSMEDDVKAFVF